MTANKNLELDAEDDNQLSGHDYKNHNLTGSPSTPFAHSQVWMHLPWRWLFAYAVNESDTMAVADRKPVI